MCTNSICRSTHHARKCRLVSSGPLSQRIAFGCPRSTTIVSSTRVTLRLAKLVSTSKAKHSRVYASTTLSTRIARPHATASWATSSAHSWFAAVHIRSGCPTRAQCLRFFPRIHDFVRIVNQVLIRKHLEKCNRLLHVSFYPICGRLVRPAHDAIFRMVAPEGLKVLRIPGVVELPHVL